MNEVHQGSYSRSHTRGPVSEDAFVHRLVCLCLIWPSSSSCARFLNPRVTAPPATIVGTIMEPFLTAGSPPILRFFLLETRPAGARHVPGQRWKKPAPLRWSSSGFSGWKAKTRQNDALPDRTLVPVPWIPSEKIPRRQGTAHLARVRLTSSRAPCSSNDPQGRLDCFPPRHPCQKEQCLLAIAEPLSGRRRLPGVEPRPGPLRYWMRSGPAYPAGSICHPSYHPH